MIFINPGCCNLLHFNLWLPCPNSSMG